MGNLNLERQTGRESDLPGPEAAGAKQEMAKLSGMPEEYPIAGLPSKWLEKDGKLIEKDVARILDQSEEVFQELPKGGVMNSAIQHRIMTVPGEVSSCKKQHHPLSDERLEQLKDTPKAFVEKELTVPSQAPLAAPVSTSR